MAIVQYLSSSQISSITGYNYIAELQYGNNGEVYGSREVNAGTPSSRAVASDAWDSYPDDGVDTQWLNGNMTLSSGSSGLTWYLNGASRWVTYNTGTISSISSVTMRAAVQNQAAMLWRMVSFYFYRDGVLQETIDVPTLGVDETTVPGGAVAEQLVTVQPTRSDNNRVDVAGQFRIRCPEGVWLNSYDTFSQILAYTGSGTTMNSMLRSPSVSLLDAEPVTTLDASTGTTSGKYTGDTFATVPLSSSSDEELLGVKPYTGLFSSADPDLLA